MKHQGALSTGLTSRLHVQLDSCPAEDPPPAKGGFLPFYVQTAAVRLTEGLVC